MIFHFAAEFGRANGNEYYEQMWSTNVLGTQNVLTFASQTSTPIVFASSSEIYGHLADEFPGLMETLPFSQTPHHQNLYALSKWVNEQQIVISGVPFVILRIFNVYGPGETYAPYRSVVVRFLGDALKGQPSVITPGSKRQFLYIDDFCRTVARIPDRFDSVHHMTFNLAGDEVLTTEELAELCGQTKLIAYQDPTTAGVKVASCELAERFLGHDPQVPLEEGIAWTRQWLKSVL
jgi:dTDP-glucose 4,6-dehydratase